MRRLSPLLILVLTPFLASAQEKETPQAHTLPLNPAANAKEGDWSTFALTLRSKVPGAKPDSPPVEKALPPSYQVWRFEKLTAEAATLRDTDLGNPKKTNVRTFSVTEAPTLEAFLAKDAKDQDKISDVATTDEKHSVAGKEFACKKVTCMTFDGKLKISWTLWFSSEVKGSGLVEMVGELQGPKKATIDIALTGFGSKDKTDWGKTSEELTQELKARDAKRDKPLPSEEGPPTKPGPKKP